jgi:hypothetical protein
MRKDFFRQDLPRFYVERKRNTYFEERKYSQGPHENNARSHWGPASAIWVAPINGVVIHFENLPHSITV